MQHALAANFWWLLLLFTCSAVGSGWYNAGQGVLVLPLLQQVLLRGAHNMSCDQRTGANRGASVKAILPPLTTRAGT